MADFETISLGGDACAICRQETSEELVTCSDCSRNGEISRDLITIHATMKAHEECLKKDHKIRRQSSLKSPKTLHKEGKEISGNVLSLSAPDTPYSSLDSSPCASGASSPLLGRILSERVNKGKENKRSSSPKIHLKWFGLKSKGKSGSSSDPPEEKSESKDSRKSSPKSAVPIEPRYFWNPKQDGAAFHVLRKLKERRRIREVQNQDGFVDQMAEADSEEEGYDSGRFLSVTLDGRKSYLSLSPYERRRSSILGGASGASSGGSGGANAAGFPPAYNTNYPVVSNKRTQADDNLLPNKCCSASVTKSKNYQSVTSKVNCDGEKPFSGDIPRISVRRASSETSIDQIIVEKRLDKQIKTFKQKSLGEKEKYSCHQELCTHTQGDTYDEHEMQRKDCNNKRHCMEYPLAKINSVSPFSCVSEGLDHLDRNDNLQALSRCPHQRGESDQRDTWRPEGNNPLPVSTSKPSIEGVLGENQWGLLHTRYNADLHPETCPNVNTLARGNPISPADQCKSTHKGVVYTGSSVIDKALSGAAHKRTISIRAGGGGNESTCKADERPFSVCNQEGIDLDADVVGNVEGKNHSTLDIAAQHVLEHSSEFIQNSLTFPENPNSVASRSIGGIGYKHTEGIDNHTSSHPISDHHCERPSISDGFHQSVDNSLSDGSTVLLIDRARQKHTGGVLYAGAPPSGQKENLFAFNQAWNASFCFESQNQGLVSCKTGRGECNGACGYHGNHDANLTHLNASLRRRGATDTSHVTLSSRSGDHDHVTLDSTRDLLDQTGNEASLNLISSDQEVLGYSDVCVAENYGESHTHTQGKSKSTPINANNPCEKSERNKPPIKGGTSEEKDTQFKNGNLGESKHGNKSGVGLDDNRSCYRSTDIKSNNSDPSDPVTCPHRGHEGSLSGSSCDVTIDRISRGRLASPSRGGGSDPHTPSSRVPQCCSSGDTSAASHVTPPGGDHVTHLEGESDNYQASSSCSSSSPSVSPRHRLLTPILPLDDTNPDSHCFIDKGSASLDLSEYSTNDIKGLKGDNHYKDGKVRTFGGIDNNKVEVKWDEEISNSRLSDGSCGFCPRDQTEPGHVGVSEDHFRFPVTPLPEAPAGADGWLLWQPSKGEQLDESLAGIQDSFPAPSPTCRACAPADTLRFKANVQLDHCEREREGEKSSWKIGAHISTGTNTGLSGGVERERGSDCSGLQSNVDKSIFSQESEVEGNLTGKGTSTSSPKASTRIDFSQVDKPQNPDWVTDRPVSYLKSPNVGIGTEEASKANNQSGHCIGPEGWRKETSEKGIETSAVDIQSCLPFSELSIGQKKCDTLWNPDVESIGQEFPPDKSRSNQIDLIPTEVLGKDNALASYSPQGQVEGTETFSVESQLVAWSPYAISQEHDQQGGITTSSRDDMVNLERAQVFKGSPDSDDCFVNEGHSENYANLPECEDIVFEPNKDLSSPGYIRPVPPFNARRRHCSEGEGAVKEKVRRYRNQSVTDEDLEKVLGKAAWLLAVADNSDRSLIRSYHEGFGYQSSDSSRLPTGLGSVDTGLNLSALTNNTEMKGWGFGSQGSRLNVSPGRTSSCSTSPVKAPGAKPLNKYAAILASVGCAPTGPATCPLSLLSGSGPNRAAQPRKPDNSGTVTWTHHTCCTPAFAASGATQTPISPCEPASPSSTKGVGNKSCSINLKTCSASFNCRAAVGQPASSPVHTSPSKAIKHPSSPQLMGLTDERTKGTRLKTSSSTEGGPAKPLRQNESSLAQTSSPKTPTKSSSAKANVVAQVSKTSATPAKTSPKAGRSQSSRSKKSSKSTSKHNSSSSSSKSSSSSSVATIECESISVTIPDRPMCIMTSSWTPDNDIMTPDSESFDRAIANQNESQFSLTSPVVLRGTTGYDWKPHRTEEYRLDNASVKYEASILHSDSLSSEADEENNRTADAHYPTSILRQPTLRSDVSEDATTTNDEDDTDSNASALSKTSLLSSKRRHRQRPLSLPSNHQLDLKLCYFNPDADEPDLDTSQGHSQQRSRADLDLDFSRSAKRHSTGQSGFDNWHSALHPLIHSQSQILQGSDLSRVAKVKILSKTSWCDCSQEFLTTSQNKRHTCPKSPTQDAKGGMTSCCGRPECKGCHGNQAEAGVTMETEGEEEDGGKMKIPKAPSDEFLTEAMKFTREKLRHRCGEDLVTLLEQFYKQIQSVSEELVLLLQERHDLHEQVDMRKIAIEQLVRLQNEAAASNDVTSIQMSVILPGHSTSHR